MIYVITDTYLGHHPKWMKKFRPDNFDELIMENWKNTVKDSDTVIHLGDVAWGKENLKKITSLPGRKVLIRGNHDDKSIEYYMDAGFVFVCDSFEMKVEGVRVLFSHRPKVGHHADINIHGHFHDLHRNDKTRLYLPLSIEHMGYVPIAMDRKFMRVIRSWVDTHHIPTVKELIEFRQDYIGEPTERDLYGTSTKEKYEACMKRRETARASLDAHGYRDIYDYPKVCRAKNEYIYGNVGAKEFEKSLCDEEKK